MKPQPILPATKLAWLFCSNIILKWFRHLYNRQIDEDVQDNNPPEPPVFDFNAEMHVTRVRADELLAQGKIEEAEQYMEARRKVFWDNGYQIRVLNQAYFAFHGAYADVPGGAAGEDLVGPAVRKLRE